MKFKDSLEIMHDLNIPEWLEDELISIEVLAGLMGIEKELSLDSYQFNEEDFYFLLRIDQIDYEIRISMKKGILDEENCYFQEIDKPTNIVNREFFGLKNSLKLIKEVLDYESNQIV